MIFFDPMLLCETMCLFKTFDIRVFSMANHGIKVYILTGPREPRIDPTFPIHIYFSKKRLGTPPQSCTIALDFNPPCHRKDTALLWRSRCCSGEFDFFFSWQSKSSVLQRLCILGSLSGCTLWAYCRLGQRIVLACAACI